MNPARSRGQLGRSVHLPQRPLRTEQLELPDPVLPQDFGGASHPAAPEDDGPPGVAPDEVPGLNPGSAGVGSRPGAGVGSTSSRRCSKAGGSESFSPRCSSGSSTVKPGPQRGDLEQHAAGLAEVDRAEVEAVDLRRRLGAAGHRLLAPVEQLLGGRGPSDVVDAAGALQAALESAARRRGRGRRAARRAPPSRRRRARTRAPRAAGVESSGEAA